MTKVIRLKLGKIKYSGDSIGDDIRIEIECLDKVFAMDKKIKRGAEVVVNAEVGSFSFDGDMAELPIAIRIIEYDIEIPDIPHPGGLHYPEARYAKIWFRVGHSGKRYIHTGEHSRGCITLLEQERWDELCKILSKARKDDGRSIGVLEVIA